MKANSFALLKTATLTAALAFAVACPALAADSTAFALAKEGNRFIGEEAKDRIVQIRSEKSIGTLVPNVWYIVYYDPDATAKAAEVKFVAGQKVSVERPARILEPITGAHKELPKDKLKIDSDRALEIAKSQPVLKDISLKASQMKLERRSGVDESPVWKVELWAAKLNNPNRNVNIGEVFISSDDGKVVRNNLDIKSVD